MKDYREVAKVLKSKQLECTPSQLAYLVVQESEGDIGQFYLINTFAEAFPNIPLFQLKRASRWHYFCESGLSDVEFDQLLSQWLNGKRGSPVDLE